MVGFFWDEILPSHMGVDGIVTNHYEAARGGGGSFKNRKRIGKIRCCESQLSERKHSPIVQRSNSLTISELVS